MVSRRSLLPSSAEQDAGLLVSARALRGFADGFVSVLLASYLDGLGFSAVQIGALVTATLLGSAALTLGAGFLSPFLAPVRILLGAALLMCATGTAFALLSDFWPLLLVAFVGTLNPSSGDVSVFLPVEQALLADRVAPPQRTSLFARYNLGGTLGGALGALASAVPTAIADNQGWEQTDAQRAGFVLHAALGTVVFALFLRLQRPDRATPGGPSGHLVQSRSIVLRLAALFSLDSFGGGFIVQSILVLWLVASG
jgi:MFS family permease